MIDYPPSFYQMKECSVGMNSVVSEKTNLSGSAVGAGCVIKEKVILTNSIIMDGVTINSGVNIKVSLGSRVLHFGRHLGNFLIRSKLKIICFQ